MAVHIDIIPNRGYQPTALLRESYREDEKVRKRTIANLSKLPVEQIELISLFLKGEQLVPVNVLFDVERSRLHGHVQAVLTAMKQLDFDTLIAWQRSRERDLVVAMVAARILEPESSKLDTTRWWEDTTLPDLLGISGADEDDLYAAMDWLLKRQSRIERKLAKRHLHDGGLVLYDPTSSSRGASARWRPSGTIVMARRASSRSTTGC